MIKKSLLFLLLMTLLAPWAANAQPLSTYTVTTGSETYTSIASTGTLLSSVSGDAGTQTVALPFEFNFGETTYASGTNVTVRADGYLYFGSSNPGHSSKSAWSSTTNYYVIAPFLNYDGNMPSGSAAAYYTSSSDMLVVEFVGLQCYYPTSGNTSDYNFQVRLHSNGNISTVYGESTLSTYTSSYSEASHNFFLVNGTTDKIGLSGSYAAPTTITSGDLPNFTTAPVVGEVITYVRPVVSCAKPTLNADVTTTTTSATLSWTPSSSEQTLFDIYWSTTNTAPTDATTPSAANQTGTSYTISGLTPGTSYYAWIRGNCGTATSPDYTFWTNAVSFNTECGAIAALGYSPNFEDFTAGETMPLCWNRINNGTSYNKYPRIYSSGGYTGNKCLYFYYYGNSSSTAITDQYAVLPEMTGLDGLQLTFMAKYGSTNQPIKIGLMTDPTDASTFHEIASQNLTTTYTEYNFILSGTGNYVAFMMPKPAVSSSAYHYIYIDDITIHTPPTCIKPTNLNVTSSGLTATVTWESDESQWQVAYATSATADPDDNIKATVTSKTYTANALTIDNDYYFWVRSYCSASDQSDWVGPVSVHIGYCVPAPTSVDNSGISNITFGTGSNIVNNSTHPTSAPFYGDYHTQIGEVQQGVETTVAITYATGYTYNTYVWVDFDNSLSFESSEVVAYGESTNTNPTTLTLTFTVPTTQAIGDYRMRIGGADSGLGSNPTSANPCYNSTFGIFEDYTLRVLEAPSCLTPTGLTATTDGATATATWTGTATSYNIDINGTVTNNVTSPYQFPVALSTDYTIKVQANCGSDGTSDWSNTFSFTTPPCVGGHTIVFSLADSYGDGWNGNQIEIMDACSTLITLTIDNGSSYSGSFDLCGDYYQFIWTTGTYPGETSFTLTDNGVTLYSNQGGSSLTNGQVLHTIGTAPTMLAKPTGLTAGTPGIDEVELSWTENGTATRWQICINDDEDNPIDANTNPFTLTGLTTDTDYTVKVRAFDKGETSCWTDEVNFTTAEACAKPTGLTATNITTESATLSWSGTNNSYVLQYRPWNPAGDDVQPTSDVMTPATYDLSSFTGTGSVVIRHYNCYNQFALVVDDIVVRNASDEIVFSEDFESCGGTMPTAFTNMDLDGDGHVWEIAATPSMKVNGTYGLASYSYDNDTYNVLYPDNWLIINNIPMGGSITFNYCAQDDSWTAENFCVYVSTENSIVEVSQTATTYDAIKLVPNTPYAWQVKGICPKYESNWTSDFFQTLNDVIFFQTDGNWNDAANWDVNRVPTADDKVQIDADAVIPSGVVAYAKTTTMGTGSITIKEGGQLKQGTTNVDVTVEKSITGYGDGDGHWYFIATPIGTTLFASSTTGWGYAENLLNGDYDLYAFDATSPTEEWYNYKANTSVFYRLFANEGYLYANKQNVTLNFIGTTPVKSLNHTITEDFTYDGTSTDPFKGWALVGNPFTCNAYINYVDAGNTVLAADFYKLNSDGNGYVLSSSNVALAPATGAFINYSATGKVQFASEAPSSGSKPAMVNMNLAQNDKTVDQARVRFGRGFNLQHMSFREDNAKLYIPQDNKDYAVVYAEQQGEMPLNFKAAENGTYTLSFSNENVEFGYLHLIDNKTGNDVDLLATPSYTFDAKYTDYASRFKLVFATTSTSDDQFAFINDGQVILSGVTGNTTVQLFDITGRMISSTNGANHISIENMTAGVYVLRLINGNDVKTQKIVVR